MLVYFLAMGPRARLSNWVLQVLVVPVSSTLKKQLMEEWRKGEKREEKRG